MANLPAMVNVDRHRQEVLLLLVADERRLEPENRLGKVQSPRPLHLSSKPERRDRAAQRARSCGSRFKPTM